MALIERKIENKIATLTINRPQALNALNTETLEALRDELKALAEEADLRCLIIKGAGEKAFVAGADISEMADKNEAEGAEFGRFGNEVFSLVASFPAPVIAAVNGYALGGGFELALACDIRIATESARFSFPETGLGITPGFGGTQRLARLAGPAIASELIFTGRRLKPDEALKLGVVNEVCPVEALDERAMELAENIASKAPIAVREAKRAIREGLEGSLADGLKLESECFGRCFASEDQKNAMQAFLKKEAFTDFANR